MTATQTIEIPAGAVLLNGMLLDGDACWFCDGEGVEMCTACDWGHLDNGEACPACNGGLVPCRQGCK